MTFFNLAHLSETSLLVALLASLGWLVLTDLRRFEVSPLAAGTTGLCIAAVQVTTATPVLIPALFGLASYGAVLLLTQLYPSRLGKGDATLFALIALASGPTALLPSALTAFLAALALTTISLLLRRRKPLSAWRRHIVPAAPAAAAAILAVVTMRTESLLASIALLVFLAAIPAAILQANTRHVRSPCKP
jgi:Flp pilus assembly protein protease CpaA